MSGSLAKCGFAVALWLILLVSPALGEVESIEQNIELRCDFPGQVMDAGDTIAFDLTIINHGETATYNLIAESYSKTKDWEITYKDGSREVYKVLLPEGATKTVTLEIATPGDADVGEYSILVRIGDDSLWLYVKIAETHKGEKGILEFTVVDKDGAAVKGATVSIYNGAARIEQMRTTAEGKISIDLPKGIYRVAIDQTGYRSREEKDVEIRIGQTTDLGLLSLDKESFSAEFVAKSPLKTIMVGSKAVYEFQIKNIGKVDDTYTLSVRDLPEGWYAGYKESTGVTEGISEIVLKSGEEKTLYLEFIPPYGVATGEYAFTSIAESTTFPYEQNLTLKIRGNLDMQVYSRGYRYDLDRGSSTSFNITVLNAGNGGSLTNVSPEVSAPQGWRAVVTPQSIASLEPAERGTFSIQLIPPADIVAGEYEVNVRVRSEQAENVDEYRIVVKEQSYIAILGILLLGAVGGGLWYMYRKYGRR